MNKYTITIEETLSKDFAIEAESLHDAIEQVRRKYIEGILVLDGSNCHPESTMLGYVDDDNYVKEILWK